MFGDLKKFHPNNQMVTFTSMNDMFKNLGTTLSNQMMGGFSTVTKNGENLTNSKASPGKSSSAALGFSFKTFFILMKSFWLSSILILKRNYCSLLFVFSGFFICQLSKIRFFGKNLI